MRGRRRGFPGYLPEANRAGALSRMCINMHVGELDSRKKGYTVRFTVEKGQAHRIDTPAGEGAARLFNQFEEARQGCGK